MSTLAELAAAADASLVKSMENLDEGLHKLLPGFKFDEHPPEVAEYLRAKYNSKAPEMRVLASVLNAVISHRKMTFYSSQKIMMDVVKKDPNTFRKGDPESFKRFFTWATRNGILKVLVDGSKARLSSVLRVEDPSLRALINGFLGEENWEAQESAVVQALQAQFEKTNTGIGNGIVLMKMEEMKMEEMGDINPAGESFREEAPQYTEGGKSSQGSSTAGDSPQQNSPTKPTDSKAALVAAEDYFHYWTATHSPDVRRTSEEAKNAIADLMANLHAEGLPSPFALPYTERGAEHLMPSKPHRKVGNLSGYTALRSMLLAHAKATWAYLYPREHVKAPQGVSVSHPGKATYSDTQKPTPRAGDRYEDVTDSVFDGTF